MSCPVKHNPFLRVLKQQSHTRTPFFFRFREEGGRRERKEIREFFLSFLLLSDPSCFTLNVSRCIS